MPCDFKDLQVVSIISINTFQASTEQTRTSLYTRVYILENRAPHRCTCKFFRSGHQLELGSGSIEGGRPRSSTDLTLCSLYASNPR